MRITDNINDQKLRGDVEIISTDKRDGSIVAHRKDSNVVVLESKQILIKLLFEGLNDYLVNTVLVGDDFGNGTSDSPEPPDETYTKSDMNVRYEVETETLSVNYSDSLTTVYNIFINGENVIENNPGDNSIIMTSMALATSSDLIFAYRRFEGITITENINTSVIWQIYYT